MDMQQLATIRASVIADKYHGIKVRIGMGTCGEIAGATTVLHAFQKELSGRGMTSVTVEPTGCLGNCQQEPVIEISVPGRSRIVYGHVQPKDVPRLIVSHLLNGNVVRDLVIGKR